MSRTVFPSSRSERIISQAARRAAGSNPVVGSSRKRISGSPIRPEREIQPSLLASGERLDATEAFLGQADEVDHVVDIAWRREVAGEQRDVLPHGEVRVHRRGLEHDADVLAPASRPPRRVGAEHGHLPGVALPVALEDLDRRRLAGTVRPEEPEHLALGDLEAHAAHRLEAVVRLTQVR